MALTEGHRQLEGAEHPRGSAIPEIRARPSGPSFWFVFGLLAIGIALGFAAGVFAFGSSWGPSQGRPLYDEGLVTSLVERASPAVVEIALVPERRSLFSRPFVGEVTGSGFLVDSDGHIVTNQHVVDVAGEITVIFHDGRKVSAARLGASAADDLALLKVDPEDVQSVEPLPLADSDSVTAGEMAIAIGSPFREFNSVTVGVVSGIDRSRATSELLRPIPGLVQTDAALNPGNSGGPLLNANGEVIGVNSAVEVNSLVQTGVGYAIPADTVKYLLDDLKAPREFKRPYLGISGIPVTREISDALGLTAQEGIYVSRVAHDSPAEAANLIADPFGIRDRKGDVIVAVNGQAVRSVTEMVGLFNEMRPGDRIWLTIERNNKSVDVNVTLAPWPDT